MTGVFMRKIPSCPTLLSPGTPTTFSYSTSNRRSSRVISPPSHQGLTGFLHSLYESITATRSPFTCLPLPDSGPKTKHVYPLLHKTFQHILFNLHDVNENLQYWEALSDLMCIAILRKHMEALTAFRTLGKALTEFLSQLYVEIDLFKEQPVSSLLEAINGFFLQLQYSLRPINRLCDVCPLSFEELPCRNEENLGSGQNDYDIINASLIHSNLNKLDLYVSILIDKYGKPSKIIKRRRRMCYAFGAIGISLFSIWLLRHSSVVRHAKESITRFFSYHVEQPLRTIRDGLSERFLNRHELKMALKELQLKSDELHRFEKHISQSNQNHIKEDISRSMLIQIQQLNDDTDTRLSELKHQLVMVDKRRSVLFVALPTYFLPFVTLMISSWISKYTTRQHKIDSSVYEERRLLIDEVECRIMQIQECILRPLHTERAHYLNGLLLYTLNRLYNDAEKDAKAFDEWESLQYDLFVLGNTEVGTLYKRDILSRLRSVYDCLYPPTTISSLSELTVGEEPFQPTPDDCLYTPLPYRIFEQKREMK